MQNLSHDNYRILRDVETYGVDAFRFSVISRHRSRKEMLAKEQLVLYAFYGRTCCYNLRPEADGDTTMVRFLTAFDPRSGKRRLFLTAHAASKEFCIRKAEINRVLNIPPYFTGGLMFYNWELAERYGYKSDAHLCDVMTQLGIATDLYQGPLPPVSNRIILRVLDANNLDHDSLGDVLQIDPDLITNWVSNHGWPEWAAAKMLVLLDRYGFEWVHCDGQIKNFTPVDIKNLRARDQITAAAFAILLNCSDTPSFIDRWESGELSPTKTELKLLNLLDVYGVKSLLEPILKESGF